MLMAILNALFMLHLTLMTVCATVHAGNPSHSKNGEKNAREECARRIREKNTRIATPAPPARFRSESAIWPLDTANVTSDDVLGERVAVVMTNPIDSPPHASPSRFIWTER
jgi:hypothetical protein